MKDIYLRTKQMATYVIETKSTVRQTAKVFGVAKSTVHYDLTTRLKHFDYSLYIGVRKVLENNFAQKSFRGGQATKEKYKQKNMQNDVK